jgi:hypothetical protein
MLCIALRLRWGKWRMKLTLFIRAVSLLNRPRRATFLICSPGARFT